MRARANETWGVNETKKLKKKYDVSERVEERRRRGLGRKGGGGKI